MTDSNARSANFITEMIDRDLAQDKYAGRVVTRFPPEPNGYLHIGHAKSICLNFGLAERDEGTCHLRFDDTNPLKEDTEYVDSIKDDVRWLGFEWGEHLYFASDYFDVFYKYAERLIEKGKAYVDSLSVEEIRELRGNFTTPGTPSPYRDRSVEENLTLFRGMKAGEFPEGTHVLRAKIDMSAPNMVMRDPLLYRIRHAHHHRTGDAWCIYPMYDYAHCIEDALEGITHSICTLEFDNNRELYDWVLRETGACPQDHPRPAYAFGDKAVTRPEQTEFARLRLEGTVMSKRTLRRLVEERVVAGWDDPRMPTVAGFRRRGVRPEAIRRFADLVGVAKSNSLVDIGKLNYCIRDDLNHVAPRLLAVLRPLKVTLTNWEEGHVHTRMAPLWPEDIPKDEARELSMSGNLYIDAADFALEPPKGWRRLKPGGEVRLRYGFVIRCDEVVTNEKGEPVELRGTYDPDTANGASPVGRKVKGTIQWVDAERAVPIRARLYDDLFTVSEPDMVDGDILEVVNPDSLVVAGNALGEPHVSTLEVGDRVQLERIGFFVVDADTASRTDGGRVMNRSIGLRDSFAKEQKKPAPAPKAKPAPAKSHAPPPARSPERDAARAGDATLAARFARYQGELGLSEGDADVLTGDAEIGAWFEAVVEAGAAPASASKWVANDVLRLRKDTPLADLAFSPADVARVIALVASDEVSATGAKTVFEAMAAGEGTPDAIVDVRGLKQVSDAGVLEALVDEVLAANADAAERLRQGEAKLLGFFVGQVMKASKGAAKPPAVKAILASKLGS